MTATPEIISTPTNTPAPAITPDIPISPSITETMTTLTIWMPVELWTASESGQATFLSQIDTYRTTHPDLTIKVEPKSVTGQGSILSYLRTGRTVAPDILPDLVALPSDQLGTAFAEQLIVNLDSYLPPTLFEDVFPAGRALTEFEGQTIGYPIGLTRPLHLVYNTAVFTDTVPATWEAFIELPEQTFVFPAAGSAGATLLLELYLAAGGTLVNDAGQTSLQLAPLILALEQLKNGRDNNFILPNSSDTTTLEESWQLFQNGNASFAQTDSRNYLINRIENEPMGPAAIPGIEEHLTPLVSGWAWAISTTDSAKRPLAADLLSFLVDIPNLGEWSRQSNLLPARQEALFFWPEEDTYVLFASEMLLEAEAHPFPPTHPVMLALGNAVFDVVSLSKSPQVAAEEAIAALEQ